MSSPETYLRLHGPYSHDLGGLAWSSHEDSLTRKDGSVFAFNEEIALLVEGFGSCGRLIHFAYLLHVLVLLRAPDGIFAARSNRLGKGFSNTGRLLRNAGAFAAVLA